MGFKDIGPVEEEQPKSRFKDVGPVERQIPMTFGGKFPGSMRFGEMLGGGPRSEFVSAGMLGPAPSPIPGEAKYLPLRIPINIAKGGAPTILGGSKVLAPAENMLVRGADTAAHLIGMVGNIGKVTQLAKPLVAKAAPAIGKIGSKVLRKVAGAGLEGAVGFGAYGAQHSPIPEGGDISVAQGLEDWSKNIAMNAGMGAALGGGGKYFHEVLGNTSPALARSAKGLYDFVLMTSLSKHSGATWEEAIADGAAATLVFGKAGTFGKTGGEKPKMTNAELLAAAEVLPPETIKHVMAYAERMVADGRAPRQITEAAESSIQLRGRGVDPVEVPRGVADEPMVTPWQSITRPESKIDRPGNRQAKPEQYPRLRIPPEEMEIPAEAAPRPDSRIINMRGESLEMPPASIDWNEPKAAKHDPRLLKSIGHERFSDELEFHRGAEGELIVSDLRDAPGVDGRRPSFGGGTMLESGGGQQMYEHIMQAARNKVRDVRISKEGKEPKKIGGFTVDELREAPTDPVRGLGLTEFTSPFRKGKIGTDEMLDNLEAGVERIQGMETQAKIAAATAKIEAAGKKATPSETRKQWLADDFRELVDAAKRGDLKDLPAKFVQLADRALSLKGVASKAQGKANVADRLLLRPLEEIDSVVNKMTQEAGRDIMEIAGRWKFNEKSRDAEALGKAMQYWNAKGGQTIDDFAASYRGQEIFLGAERPAEMVEFLREVRPVIEQIRNRMDRIDKLFGGKGVSVLDDPNAPGYLTKTYLKRNPLNIFGRLKDVAVEEVPSAGPQRTGPTTRWNPYKKRDPLKGDENRDWNFFRALDPYMQEMGNQGRTIAIHHNEMAAEALRDAGMHNLADSVSKITHRHMNNKAFGAEKGINEWFDATAGGRVLQEVLVMNKRRFDNTRYRGNPAMQEAQSRSLYMLVARNPVAFAKSIPDLFDSKIWEANKQSEIARIKSQPFGGRTAGESGGEVGQPETLRHRGKLKSVREKILDSATKNYEMFTTQVGLNIGGRRLGDDHGLTPREFADARNDWAKLTQQQYDPTGTAPFMNTKALRGTFVAMRYRVDSHIGQHREVWSDAIGDHYEGGKWNHKKIAETGKILAGMGMADTVSMMMRGYGSGGVVASLVLHDIFFGEEKGYPAQARTAAIRALRHFKDEEFSDGLALIFSEIIPLAKFGKNIKDTKEAWDSGEITNPLELPWSATFGASSTASGRNERYGAMFDDPLDVLPANPNAADGLNLPQMLFYRDGNGKGTGSPRPTGENIPAPRPSRPTARPQQRPKPRRRP